MIEALKHKLIVSCQALEDDPLYGSDIMAKMAIAAQQGGAGGIRAQGIEDILAIQKVVDIPIIGIIKRDYEGTEIYITPSKKEVDELLETGCEIIALDATTRNRPSGDKLEDLLEMIHAKDILAMADCSTMEEALNAEKIGFDIISSTLSGYTPYSRQSEDPDYELIGKMVKEIDLPVFAEGKIRTFTQVKKISELGVDAIVVGGAITRPQEITTQFVKTLNFKDRKD